jgi:hypothetical protein
MPKKVKGSPRESQQGLTSDQIVVHLYHK